MAFSLSATILCSFGSGFSMQNPKGFPSCLQSDLKLGLKTLIYPEPENSTVAIHSYMVWGSSKPSPKTTLPPPSFGSSFSDLLTMNCSSSCSCFNGDLIGNESGVHIMLSSISEEEMFIQSFAIERSNKRSYMDRYRDRRQESYPPPLPSLAQTGNLRARTPWVLTKHYRDGRLILEGEKLKRHEYFEARRENGRLILNLVSMAETENENENDPEAFLDLKKGEFEEEEEEEIGVGEEEIYVSDRSAVIGSHLENVLNTTLGNNTPKCSTFACGMFMEPMPSRHVNMYENVHAYLVQPSSSAPLVPMASAIM